MAKKKKKKNKIPYYIAALSAVFAALSVCLALYSSTLNTPNEEPDTAVSKDATPDISVSSDGSVVSRTMYDGPMLKTDMENIFLSVHPSGIFTFYENRGGSLSVCPDTETVNVTVPCSHQNLPATLYCLERDGIFMGYGLFTTSICTEDIRLFDYAFFRATNTPEGYGDSKCLLMVDFNGNDFASDNKTYSEIFSFDPESGKTAKLTGDNGRTVDRYGRLRSDWAQLNDALLDFSANRLYLSGRNYLLSSTTADLLFIEGNTKTKPTLKVSSIYKNHMNCVDGKLYYVREADEGFSVCSLDANGTETVVSSYSGSVDDYILSGDYILNKNSLVLKRISTDENKADLADISEKTAYPEFMSVSKDGKKLVILCNTSPQTVILCDISNGSSKIIRDENLFTNTCSQIQWLSENSFMTVYQKSANEYETLVWKF